MAVKPRNGVGGKGFRMIDVNDDLPEIYRELILEPPLIAEEYIFQTGLLHELNPSSVNTVRLITLRNKDAILLLDAYVRIGRVGSLTDNFHTRGVTAEVRMADGLMLDGEQAVRNHLSCHPDSGVRFSGETIPRWGEVVDLCIRAHEIAPEGLDLIGWDVCVDETHLLLIEGNNTPGFGAYRKGNPNGWKLFKEYLNEAEKAGRL